MALAERGEDVPSGNPGRRDWLVLAMPWRRTQEGREGDDNLGLSDAAGGSGQGVVGSDGRWAISQISSVQNAAMVLVPWPPAVHVASPLSIPPVLHPRAAA